MTDHRGVLREISWRDLCPWLMLVRAVGCAFSMRVLLLAVIGAALTPVGWQLGDWLFRPAEQLEPGSSFAQLVERQTAYPHRAVSPFPAAEPQALANHLLDSPRQVTLGWRRLAEPAGYLFHPNLSWRQLAWLLWGMGWSIGVWSLLGGAITRLAIMQLGPEEPVGLTESWRYSVQHAGAQALAPLSPLLGMLGLMLPLVLAGWLVRLDAGLVAASLGWGLALLVGLGLAWLASGLLFGWPLLWGTLAVEGSDAFDAMARAYSYPVRRPLHALFYTLVAVALGALGWLWVHFMAELTLNLTWWGVAWGAGEERMMAVHGTFEHGGEPGTTGRLAVILLGGWTALVRAFPAAFSYAWLWCSAGGVYLLLRLAVDGRETDEVFRESEAERYRLAAMGLDPASLAAEMPAEAPPSRDGERPVEAAPPAETDPPPAAAESEKPPPE